MHPVSLNLDKRVGFGYDGKVTVGVEISPKRKRVFWPSTVEQPPAMVRFHAPDAQQIADGPFHSQGAWKDLAKAWTGRLGSAVHLVLDDGDSTRLEVSGIHPKS